MINKIVKFNVYKKIVEKSNYLGSFADSDKIMLFLQKIWPLRAMPSEDDRYSNAYDDTFQHIVNNNDWDDDELFLSRFKLIDGDDEYYTLFLEAIVHPETRVNISEIKEYVELINNSIADADVKLLLSDYFEELPVYKLRDKNEFRDLPTDIAMNSIPFFKNDSTIDAYPCFILHYDSWDDYGSKTTMSLSYLPSATTLANQYIGRLKIMKRDVLKTWEILDSKFTYLPNDFCSLGQDTDYYIRLKQLFPDNYQNILLALRDAALFPKISEEFEKTSEFINSLVRTNTAEKTFRTVKFELQSGNMLEYYKFTYSFKPPFGDEMVHIRFDFDYSSKVEHRIIALIGKNGTGKTTILSSLINDFAKQQQTKNLDKKPIFGKYFTVSYSIFDHFPIPEANATFNYIYCGLKKVGGANVTLDEQLQIFYAAAEKIKDRDLTYQWFNILHNFLSQEHLKLIFPSSENELSYSMVTFSAENFTNIKDHFSSGESILIFIITKIISEIRENSLILYDEPETHLHPNAISSLMNSLFELLTTFKSFCIIATHSPLVIRELHLDDVYVLKRDQTNLEISKLDIDSFGENLTVITEEIFGNRDVNKHYAEVMKKLVDDKYNFEQIIEMIQNQKAPLSLSTRLYLKSLISQKNEKPNSLP